MYVVKFFFATLKISIYDFLWIRYFQRLRESLVATWQFNFRNISACYQLQERLELILKVQNELFKLAEFIRVITQYSGELFEEPLLISIKE